MSEVSPTLTFDRRYCSICGADDLDCEHVPGKLYDSHRCYETLSDITDVWEVSLVWAGQQRNTQLLAASRWADFGRQRTAPVSAARERDWRSWYFDSWWRG